jgi:hypothetical protein
MDPEEMLGILLRMLPAAQENEFFNMVTQYNTYQSMKKFILDAVQYRTTSSPAPMFFNLEDDQVYEEYPNEDGDLELFRIETIGGKKTYFKTSKGKGKGKGGTILCYRCGNNGHISPNCKALKHKNGGPCKEKPPPRAPGAARPPNKAAHALEEEVEQGSLENEADTFLASLEDDIDDDIFFDALDTLPLPQDLLGSNIALPLPHDLPGSIMCNGSSILAKTKKLMICGKLGVGGCRCCGVVGVEEVVLMWEWVDVTYRG